MGFWLSWEPCTRPRSRLQPLETWGLPPLSRRSSLLAAVEAVLCPWVSDGMVPVQGNTSRRGTLLGLGQCRDGDPGQALATGSPTPVTYLEAAPGSTFQGSAAAIAGSGAARVWVPLLQHPCTVPAWEEEKQLGGGILGGRM